MFIDDEKLSLSLSFQIFPDLRVLKRMDSNSFSSTLQTNDSKTTSSRTSSPTNLKNSEKKVLKFQRLNTLTMFIKCHFFSANLVREREREREGERERGRGRGRERECVCD